MSAKPSTPVRMRPRGPLFDQLDWRDPDSKEKLEPIVSARTPAGVPICGALRVAGTNRAYPIVDCVARITPELAHRHRDWLNCLGLEPAGSEGQQDVSFQDEATVSSFGFQWAWNSTMRPEKDLRWRVADRFRQSPDDFSGKLTLDAGAGAGDQSRWLLDQGASVVSIDLSSAIDVVAGKLRMNANWVGVQGDITVLPFAAEQFDVVYCEGVIQHTRDSALTVRELCRVLCRTGRILATHYGKPKNSKTRIKHKMIGALRKRLSSWDRYKLLLATGLMAATAYIPLLGRLIRKSGMAIYYDLVPDFKTTWTNTFDTYGDHAYQRHVRPDEFWSYFQQAGGMERLFFEDNVLVAEKRSKTAQATKAA